MLPKPSIAIVIEHEQVKEVIFQDWPSQVLLPRIAVVDYDIKGVIDPEITRFPVGNCLAEAICYSASPVIHDPGDSTLSPNAVLAAMNESGNLTD